MRNFLMVGTSNLWTQQTSLFDNAMLGIVSIKKKIWVTPSFNAYQGTVYSLPTFTCRVDGSWKHDGTTSGVKWIIQLQDGSIDLVGLQGCHIGLIHAIRLLEYILRFIFVFSKIFKYNYL